MFILNLFGFTFTFRILVVLYLILKGLSIMYDFLISREKRKQEKKESANYVLIDYSNTYANLPIDSKVVVKDGTIKNASQIKKGDVISFVKRYPNWDFTEFVICKVGCVTHRKEPLTCFSGDCLVSTILGPTMVKDLVVGDCIQCPNGKMASVKCIIETKISKSTEMMCHENGLIITHYHPVRFGGVWVFPESNLSFTKKRLFVDSIYSIGLDYDVSFLVNGVEVIGLGHGIYNDPVATHPYFGTERVINDIFEISRDGHCVIYPEQVLRNPETGLVDKIKK